MGIDVDFNGREVDFNGRVHSNDTETSDNFRGVGDLLGAEQ